MMRIDRVEIRLVEIPLRFPFQTSLGREDSKVCLLVTVFSDGVAGWGEVAACRAPLYNEETVETAWHVLKDFLVPLLFSREWSHPRDFARACLKFRRNHMARAGLESAVWDLYSSRLGRPLSEVLGGTRSAVAVGISLGLEEQRIVLLGRVEQALEVGYRRVKLKIAPGHDLELLREVRAAFPDAPLQVDANAAYGPRDMDRLVALDEIGLQMLEQPFGDEDLVDHARLQKRMRTPVCLDESLDSPDMVRAAAELGACRVVNLKPGRVGGVHPSLQIHELCRERRLPLWCGGMLETGVGRLHNLALASLKGFTLPGDLSASDRYFERDLIDPPVRLNPDGTVDVPVEVGIDCRVDHRRLAEVTLRTEQLR
ncbi:MAG: o-succinylbenzoate synthase [Armatimonadetes bacterium]|nr:o-succinylbenzoate synthase [Armatimonadota bacterium]